MFKNKFTLGAVLALGLTPVSAMAQSADWSGTYVGAAFGYGSANYDILVDLPAAPLSANLPDLGGQGFVGSLQAGYRQQFDQFILGGQIDGTWGNIENDTSLNAPGVPFDLNSTLAMTSMYTLSLRAGYLVNPETQIYGLVGYSRGTFDGDLTSSSTPGINTDYSYDLNGVTFGGGLETLVTDAVSVGIEYKMTNFDDNNLADFGGGNRIDLETNVQTVQVFMNYRF